ncbi:hypothetical protein T01_14838 [Trichinella spiralis]|uniref:Uncharacterized protein n=1 Tax=Trichinella spiralis TaxID=6334 RepID=A0A0V1BDW7_TRISP|nr:hypothetical protein T01_14838 [Trichinella spiralis]
MALNLCTIVKVDNWWKAHFNMPSSIFHTAKPDASSNKCNSLLKRTIRFEKLKFYQQLFPARCDYTNRMSKLDTVNWSLIIDMLYAEWHLNESANKEIFHKDFQSQIS